MNRFTHVLAAVALVAGLSLTAQSASASSTPTGGSGGRGAQGQYLTTTTPVDITINPACSSISADPINFSSVTPSTATSAQNFSVAFTCGAGVAPKVTFADTGVGGACAMSGTGGSVPYTIYDINNFGTQLCQGGGGSSSGPFYQSNGSETSHVFQAQVVTLTGSPGTTVYPKVGSYHDDLSVYIEF